MTSQKFINSITELQNNEITDQNNQDCLHNYHRLLKVDLSNIQMKKLLADTEKKMFNRIKLFQKASKKVLKKKEHEMKVYQKLEAIKKDPLFSRKAVRPKTRQQGYRSLSRQSNQKNITSYQIALMPLSDQKKNQQDGVQSTKKILAEKINEERIKNVRLMKEDKQRNNIIIQQRKKREMNKKLQSANIIRRQRQKVKLMKEQILKEKQEDFKKFIEQKYEKQKDQFIKLQIHLCELQQKQKQALITWKKTIQRQVKSHQVIN